MSNPAATLRPTGFAYEAAGELRIDTIVGMTMTVTRSGGLADVMVRHGERRIGDGQLEWQTDDAWSGQITIHGIAWDAEAISDRRAREWRVSLKIPPRELAG